MVYDVVKEKSLPGLITIIFILVCIIILEFVLIWLYRLFGAKIIINNEYIQRKTFYKITKKMRTKDIEDYGVFYHKRKRFIYISDHEMNKEGIYKIWTHTIKKKYNVYAVYYEEEIIKTLDKIMLGNGKDIIKKGF